MLDIPTISFRRITRLTTKIKAVMKRLVVMKQDNSEHSTQQEGKSCLKQSIQKLLTGARQLSAKRRTKPMSILYLKAESHQRQGE